MKKEFIVGVATGLILAGASFVFANSQIQAILNNQIKVTLNGITQEFRDETTNEIQYPITYHDRTYLPLRTVANLVGVGVDYDVNTNTALLSTSNFDDMNDIEMTENDLNGTWNIINPDISPRVGDEYFVFGDNKKVDYWIDYGVYFEGTYSIYNNTVSPHFTKLIIEGVHSGEYEVDYSVNLDFVNKTKLKIVYSPTEVTSLWNNLGDIEKDYLLDIFKNPEYPFDKIGGIYEKNSEDRENKHKEIAGTWNLREECMPKGYTVPSRLIFNDKTVRFIGSYSYNVDGGYSIDGDIIEIYFKSYTAMSVDQQPISEQTVRLRIVDNKLVRLPYVVHVLKVCNTLMNLKLPLNEHELDILYASALLHDIIEDCKDKLPKGGIELVKDNGLDTEILEIIQLLSKRSGATEDELLEYFNAIKYNKLAVLIKLADRGHNVETLSSMKLEKIHKYTKETRDYIYPLCSYAKRHYPEITNGVTILKSKIVSLTEETETLLSMFEHEKGKESIHKEQEEESKQNVVDENNTEKGLDNNGQE